MLASVPLLPGWERKIFPSSFPTFSQESYDLTCNCVLECPLAHQNLDKNESIPGCWMNRRVMKDPTKAWATEWRPELFLCWPAECATGTHHVLISKWKIIWKSVSNDLPLLLPHVLISKARVKEGKIFCLLLPHPTGPLKYEIRPCKQWL